MATKRWDGAAWVDVANIKRWDGASWVAITTYKRWDGSAWVDIAIPGAGGGSLSVIVSPGSASGQIFNPEPAPLFETVVTNSVTAVPSGGTGPYTYSWSQVSGDSSISANSPTAATTSFSAIISKNTEANAVQRVTVTDSLSATASADISVHVAYNTNL